jgi:hypothetical protein
MIVTDHIVGTKKDVTTNFDSNRGKASSYLANKFVYCTPRRIINNRFTKISR